MENWERVRLPRRRSVLSPCERKKAKTKTPERQKWGDREQLEKGGAVGFPIWALRIVDASTKTWVSPSPTSKFRSDPPQETLHKSRNSSRAAFVAFGLFPHFPSNVYFLSKYDEPHFRTKTCFSREKGWLKLREEEGLEASPYL